MRVHRFGFAAAMLLLSVVSGFAQEKSGAIKGKVHVEKGSPAGVAVILSQSDREVARTATDKKGEFVIHVVPGLYAVTFRKAGLSTASIPAVEVKAGKTRSLSDGLNLGVDEGSIVFIRGSVFTEAGRSVPGVRVELSRIISETSIEKMDLRVTGETGEFVFRLPPETAKYRVTLKADGIVAAAKDIEVDGAAVYRVALTMKLAPK